MNWEFFFGEGGMDWKNELGKLLYNSDYYYIVLWDNMYCCFEHNIVYEINHVS